MSNLSADQIQKLAKALTSTLDLNDLESFVYVSTGDQLFRVWVGPGQPLYATIRALLLRLEDEGLTPKFLKEVYINRPYKTAVRELIAAVCPEAASDDPTAVADFSVQKQGVAEADVQKALLPGLQKNVKPHLRQLDIMTWVARLLSAKTRTCRVEFDASAAGTGFLVGPQAVLTNWHVVKPACDTGRVAELACRFDYAIQADGSKTEGTVVPLAPGGVVHHRPYAAAEATGTPDTPPPTLTELDFALLHLSRPIGNEPCGSGTRGWIGLPPATPPLAPRSPIIIVQHPDGAPIKMAIDTEAILPVPAPPERPRIRYATNTEPGSSGSPCFTMDWDIVALHHFGDPAWQAPAFNQGIPISLIRADIEAAGHGDLLGPLLAA